MSESLNIFLKFLADEEAWEMFIYGPAGSGKTTNTEGLVQYCMDNDISYRVCAHTHKACGVLRSVLPKGADIGTLHSFLRKRPTINTQATRYEHIESNMQHDEPERAEVLIVDEFSMVGEKDLMDIRGMQDPDYEGEPGMKVVWVGDQHQLPPVKDMQTLIPDGPYQVKLTKIYRSKGLLLEPLSQLVRYIEGDDPEPLKENESFIRGIEDLAGAYKACKEPAVILAYTNEEVQNYNLAVAGYDEPMPGDMLFSPSVHREFTFNKRVLPEAVAFCDQYRDGPLTFNSKYKTLEFMLKERLCDFYEVYDLEDGEVYLYPVIFGTYNHKVARDKAGQEATRANKEIEQQMNTKNANAWAKQNPKHPLARKRAKAWRVYLTLKETVLCMDFPYAMTVHKSQGSTYDHVFLDSEDLAKCRDKNFMLYLKLFYVAMSRARKTVTTN